MSGPAGPTPARILVVMPRWVGDAVMATPLLEALHGTFPDAAKHLLYKRYLRGLFDDAPWADRGIELHDGASFRGLRAELARERYDLGLLLPNSFRPALLLWAARVRRRVGYRRNGRAPLLTDGLPFPRERPFRMSDFYGRLGDVLGLPDTRRAMRLYASEAAREEARDLLARHGVDPRLEIVGLNPGAKYGSSKLWPTGHFAAVGDALVDQAGVGIVLLAGPGEDDLAREIAGRMTRPATVLPSVDVDLATLKSVLTCLDLLVSNDTGPRHMAAALGTPTVTVFGPTHAEWGRNEHPAGIDVSIPVDCGPCMQRTCPLGHHRCMTDLQPDRVIEAALEMLARRGRLAGPGDSRSPSPIVDRRADRHARAGE